MADKLVHFVFDLDDTLYMEEDYVCSALTHVGESVAERYALYGAVDRLLALRAAGGRDPVADLWREHSLPIDAKIEILASMRAHDPAIDLRPDAAVFIDQLRRDGGAYAIVTDGRSITQRAKIKALGCCDANYISVSEEVGLVKTDPARFSAVAECFGIGRYVYVGDNPAKDFLAPNRLGWLTVMLRHDGRGIHKQDLPADPNYHARGVIDSFDRLTDTISELERGLN